jgi:hypothetical protein
MKAALALLTLLTAAAPLRASAQERPTPPALLSFKMDFPTGATAGVTTSGIGVYPINVAVSARRLAVRPYGSLGAAASIVRSAATNPDGAAKILAVVVQPRVAVGASYAPLRGLVLSTELTCSPGALGIVSLATAGRGGRDVGPVLGLSIGAEWL